MPRIQSVKLSLHKKYICKQYTHHNRDFSAKIERETIESTLKCSNKQRSNGIKVTDQRGEKFGTRNGLDILPNQ
jgi:hypothetical protein